MKRVGLTALVVCCAVFCSHRSAHAVQIQIDSISPEDSARADNASLFQSHEPLELILEGNLKDFKRDRSEDPEERPAQLSFRDADGSLVTVPVKIRTRGNWRLQKRNCNFPNWRLNLPKKRVDNTVFDGQDKLKVVTPCQDNRDDYQQYVLQEYLAYRIYNLFTDASFRVRLARMTYIDTAGKPDTLRKTIFLIEDEDQLAARHRMTILDMQGIQHDFLDPDLLTLMLVFQYMTGNTDWSVSGLHNIKLLVDVEQIPIAVPFDFDWTGIVNTRYAKPDPSLRIRRVTERLWRGFCKPEQVARAELEPVLARFNEQKDAVYALYAGAVGLDERQLRGARQYLDKFYDTINNAGRVRRDLIRTCRR